MRILTILAGICAGLAFNSAAALDATSPWPTRSLTLITPAPPGGAVDLTAHVLAEGFAAQLKQPVHVDPRPGADGILAAQAFLSASDPGHTFLVTFGGLLVNNPVSYDKLPYDVTSDFVPVALLATDTIVICATAELPASDLPSLVLELRARPDTVRWASAPGEPKLRFLGLLKEIEVPAVFVPYKSLNQAVIDMMGGRIEVVVAPLASVRAHLQTGRLKLLATMAAERSPAAPDVPSVAEAGYHRLAMIPFIGLLARSGTNPLLVERLGQEVGAALADPSADRRLRNAGLTPAGGNAQAFADVVAEKLSENRELARLVGPNWR